MPQLRASPTVGRRLEVGGWRLEVGGWRLEVGGKVEVEVDGESRPTGGGALISRYAADDEIIWLYLDCYGICFRGLRIPGVGRNAIWFAYFVMNSTSMPVVAGNGAILLSVCDAEAGAKDRNSGN